MTDRLSGVERAEPELLRDVAQRLKAERDRLAEALRNLVRLKDGPRDDAYRAAKDAAWQAARDALDEEQPK